MKKYFLLFCIVLTRYNTTLAHETAAIGAIVNAAQNNQLNKYNLQSYIQNALNSYRRFFPNLNEKIFIKRLMQLCIATSSYCSSKNPTKKDLAQYNVLKGYLVNNNNPYLHPSNFSCQECQNILSAYNNEVQATSEGGRFQPNSEIFNQHSPVLLTSDDSQVGGMDYSKM